MSDNFDIDFSYDGLCGCYKGKITSESIADVMDLIESTEFMSGDDQIDPVDAELLKGVIRKTVLDFVREQGCEDLIPSQYMEAVRNGGTA